MNENKNSPLAGGSSKALYFIGIGGIGMSALARYFHTQGWIVSGYDKTSTALTKELEASGISIHYEENVSAIPKDVRMVVYTPAIPKEHKELLFYQQNGYKVVKRSDVLQIITESSFNICIAGTHGKTTITTMTAHLLRDTGYGCNAFLGGISVNYGTNFWSNERNVCVIEADEYDRSFLKLSPDIAIISSMDPDHLDIYGTAEAMEQAFIDFSGKIKADGLLISKYGLKRGKELKRKNHLTYSLNDTNADVYASNIRMKNGSYGYDVIIRGGKLENVVLNMGGMHNVENSLAAIAAASSLNIDGEKIKLAVASFMGVKRRFQYIIKNEEFVFIDDYAHHPEELRALISGAKGLFGDKKCIVIFQPHLYSRTKDFADGFAEVLDMADEIILLPIYPARELPIEGVTSELIIGKMKNKNKIVLDKTGVLDWVKSEFKKRKDCVLITAGAGDIDTLIDPIKQILS
ncbi:MAG: UDP-N-acetylmuramate--L-alanine ligase [Bacteroidetes bacterium]|nr:UDP-N-acetylmuramate--L-alanine ligase [Bacteroidota bacterium]MBS1607488.1 UDP-N-acetylmuramate--L-alanine ligase [Bacteroidota bacterium]